MTESELCALEVKIRTHLLKYRDIGHALLEIGDGKGYRLRGYANLEAYCEGEFGFSDRHGRRLVEAAEVADTLERLCGEIPQNESVAREFVAIGEQENALCEVVEALRARGLSVSSAKAGDVRAVIVALFKARGLPVRKFFMPYEDYTPAGGALTQREREVLTLIAHGASCKEAGRELCISRQTVKNHCSKIYEKLGARSAAHAVWLAFVEEQG